MYANADRNSLCYDHLGVNMDRLLDGLVFEYVLLTNLFITNRDDLILHVSFRNDIVTDSESPFNHSHFLPSGFD